MVVTKNVSELRISQTDDSIQNQFSAYINYFQNQSLKLLDEGKKICEGSQKTYLAAQKKN